jgi:hypothetical protein
MFQSRTLSKMHAEILLIALSIGLLGVIACGLVATFIAAFHADIISSNVPAPGSSSIHFH